jgi:hypothetical protein
LNGKYNDNGLGERDKKKKKRNIDIEKIEIEKSQGQVVKLKRKRKDRSVGRSAHIISQNHKKKLFFGLWFLHHLLDLGQIIMNNPLAPGSIESLGVMNALKTGSYGLWGLFFELNMV